VAYTQDSLAKLLRFDPVTYRWIGEGLSRITIEGEIDGFKVVVHVEPDDLSSFDEDGEFNGINEMCEVGVIPMLVDQVRSHGIGPAFVKRNAESSASVSQGTMTSDRWKCPEHGDASIYPAKFGTGLQCNRWEEAAGKTAPGWANPKLRDVNGQLRFYCKFREVPQAPRS